jgi:hypothetical protein
MINYQCLFEISLHTHTHTHTHRAMQIHLYRMHKRNKKIIIYEIDRTQDKAQTTHHKSWNGIGNT